jgi:hypothetical protein
MVFESLYLATVCQRIAHLNDPPPVVYRDPKETAYWQYRPDPPTKPKKKERPRINPF